MRKIAFYKLETEGKLFRNYKTKDLIFAIITLGILIIPITFIFSLIPLDFSGLEKIGVNSKIIKTSIVLFANVGITFFLTNPEKHTDYSIVKSMFYPQIKYMMSNNVYSNYQVKKEKRRMRRIRVIIKYYKIEILILITILTVIISIISVFFVNNFSEYNELLPQALDYNLNYEENNLLVKDSTIEKMKKDISKAQKQVKEKIPELDSYIKETNIKIDEKEYSNINEEYKYKYKIVDQDLDGKIVEEEKGIEKLKINNYSNYIKEKNEILGKYEIEKTKYDQRENKSLEFKNSYLTKIEKVKSELNDLLLKAKEEEDKHAKEIV